MSRGEVFGEFTEGEIDFRYGSIFFFLMTTKHDAASDADDNAICFLPS
jgi:hypothetical protein